MSNPKVQVKPPFKITHKRKKDNLDAMLLAMTNGVALFRVRFFEAGRMHDNTVSTSLRRFETVFKGV